MSTFNYARSKATADRLIKRFGKTTASTLKPPPTKAGAAFNPTLTAATALPVSAVVLSYNTKEIGDGSRIQSNDRKVYVAVGDLGGTKITTEWKLNIKMQGDTAAKDYRIMNVDPLEPGDITLLWEIQCRAA